MTPATEPISLDDARRARRLRQLATDTALAADDPAALIGRAAGLLARAAQHPATPAATVGQLLELHDEILRLGKGA